MSDVIKDFISLFQGNTKSYGQWVPETGHMYTEKKEATAAKFKQHLEGELGIGIVPILNDGTCWWAAIDIDNHEGKYISPEAIARKVYQKGLPLIPVLSKSGGVHCYMFGAEPLPASTVKVILSRWAKDLGHAGAEVFPKQSALRDNQLGNWINLPYFKAVSTNRYAMECVGDIINKMSLDEFVAQARIKSLTVKTLQEFALIGHEDAPPCVQYLLTHGVETGHRNEALYNISVYLKKAMPTKGYKDAAFELNSILFEKPLSLVEAKKTIESAGKRDYKYKCMEEPCRSHCDSDVCLTREHGISREETSNLTVGNMPTFEKLSVFQCEPPMWELIVDGTPIILTTAKIRYFPSVAEAIMEKIFKVVPPMNQKDWMGVLATLMAGVEVIEVPDNASISGMIRERLLEFVSRANLESYGEDTKDRDLMERGIPVVQAYGEPPHRRRMIMFRGIDFVNFLKRTRSEELKGNLLWIAIREMGAESTRLRVGGKVQSVWMIPIDGANRTKLDIEFDPKIKYTGNQTENVVNLISAKNHLDF